MQYFWHAKNLPKIQEIDCLKYSGIAISPDNTSSAERTGEADDDLDNLFDPNLVPKAKVSFWITQLWFAPRKGDKVIQ